MDAIWTGVYESGTDRKTVIVRFRDASIDDIRFHLANLDMEMRKDGYTLKSYELKENKVGGAWCHFPEM